MMPHSQSNWRIREFPSERACVPIFLKGSVQGLGEAKAAAAFAAVMEEPHLLGKLEWAPEQKGMEGVRVWILLPRHIMNITAE